MHSCAISYTLYTIDTLPTEGSVTIEYSSPIYAVPLRYDIAFDVYSGPPSNSDCIVMSNGTAAINLIEQVDVFTHEYRDANQPDVTSIGIGRSIRKVETYTCTTSSRYLENGALGRSPDLTLSTQTTST